MKKCTLFAILLLTLFIFNLNFPMALAETREGGLGLKEEGTSHCPQESFMEDQNYAFSKYTSMQARAYSTYETGVSPREAEYSLSGETDVSGGLYGEADLGSNEAYGVINSSFVVSNNSLLYDCLDLQPIVSPEPRRVEGMKDPTAVETYYRATGEVVRISSDDLAQRPVEMGLNSLPPYQGLFSPGLGPESVFPPDDRVRITPTTTFPWRTICKLNSTFPDGAQGGCSGAIIGCPNGHGYHVLTAGHCVYSHDHGGWVTDVEIIPGYDGGYMPYYKASWTEIRSYTGWTEDADHRHDWAVITLDRNVGDYTGWMGRMTAHPGNPVYTGVLNTAGYPSDLSSGQCMYWDADSGRTADEYNNWYYMDTAPGQSGSPVWVYYPETDERYILTVHAYGDDGSGSNHGTRLNQDKFDRIIAWCNEDTPPTDYADLIDDGQAYSGFSPTTVAPGDSFYVWCSIRNIGTAPSGSFHVSYYASTDTIINTADYLVGTDYVSSISPFSTTNSEWEGTFPDSIASGTYWIGWIIDSGSDVTEFDETNNVAYKDSHQLTVEILHSSISITETLNPLTSPPYEAVQVYGTATFEDGSPVSYTDVTMTITETGASWTTTTDASGYYSRYISAPGSGGIYTVRVDISSGELSGWNSKTLTVHSLPGGDYYTLYRTTTCKDVQPSSPYDPIDETEAFRASDSTAYTWIHLTYVYRSLQVKWEWYKPDNSYYTNCTYTVPDPADYGYDYWEWYKCWCGIYINGYAPADIEGRWRSKVYIDEGSGYELQAIEEFVIRYEVTGRTMAKDVQISSPYEPIDPTNAFLNTDPKALAWIRFDEVAESLDIKWEWLEPSGATYSTFNWTTEDPADSGYLYWDWYKAWCSIHIYEYPPQSKLGTWEVRAYVKDVYGNWDLEYSQYFTISDNTPPGTPGTPIDDGVYSTSGTVMWNWTAAPEDGEVAQYQLQVGTTPGGNDFFDGLVGTDLTKTLDNLQDGLTYYARVRAMNTVGQWGPWSNSSDGITVDTISPETVIEHTPRSSIVSLSASDATSDVATTYYRIDSGPWNVYTDSFVLAGTNSHLIEYYSEDNAGNKESIRSLIVHYLIVNTNPLGLNSPSGEGWYDHGTNATISISPVSSYIFLYWYLDGQSDTPYSTGMNTSVTMDTHHTATAKFTSECSVTFYTDPSTKGSITFNGKTYVNGESDTFDYGTSGDATANVPSGCEFDHWEVTGNVEISDPNANPTTLTITCGGTVKAIFTCGPTVIYLDPSETVGPPPNVGENFTWTIRIDNVTGLYLWRLDLSWDPAILELQGDPIEGNCLKSGGSTTFMVESVTPGHITGLTCTLLGGIPGVNVPPAPNDLAYVTFKVLNYTCSLGTWIIISDSHLLDQDGIEIPHVTRPGKLTLCPPDLTVSSITVQYDRAYFYGNVRDGCHVDVNITNIGNADAGPFNVTFNVIWMEEMILEYSNTTLVDGLSKGATKTLHYQFTITHAGNYNVTAMVDSDYKIPESDENNNTLTRIVKGRGAGDINGDGKVDYKDLFKLARAYGSKISDSNWNPDADINCDGRVDYKDLFLLAKNYGKTFPDP